MSNTESKQTDEMLAAVAAGDPQALERLMGSYAPYLRRIIQCRISPELAARIDESDVMQETQIVVMRRINEFIAQRPSSFRVWLRSRAIEQLVDQHRRHVGAEKRSVRREKHLVENSSLAIARVLISETPSRLVRNRETTEQIRDLIDGLDEIDREVLTLRHVDGLTNAESAEVLDVPVATARKRYGRALRRLVEFISSAGIDLGTLSERKT